MATVNDDVLLTCGSEERFINQVHVLSGKVTPVFSTGRLYPHDICKTPGGDLFATVVDKLDFNVNSDSERVLVRYSPTGWEMGRAHYDRQGDAIFIKPFRLRISNTGRIIGVLNITDQDNNHLVLLNTDLTLRLQYLGNGKVVSGEDKFDTTIYKPYSKYGINDFIFDSFDNIIIVEGFSKCVQLLSKDCVPLHTLLPIQEYTPVALTINGDEMWLGFKDGTVKVYQCT